VLFSLDAPLAGVQMRFQSGFPRAFSGFLGCFRGWTLVYDVN
jgi:hypothetical protein